MNPTEPNSLQNPGQPGMSPQPQNKNQKTVVTAILVAAVVVVLAIIMIVMWQGKSSDQANNKAGDNSASQESPLETKPYTSDQYGFSIQYPKGWKVADKPDTGNQATIKSPTSDSIDGNAYVSRISLTTVTPNETVTLADVENALTQGLSQSQESYKLISNDSTTLGGVPGKLLNYTAIYPDGNNVMARYIVAYFVKDGKIYEATGAAPESKWSTYEKGITEALKTFKSTK